MDWRSVSRELGGLGLLSLWETPMALTQKHPIAQDSNWVSAFHLEITLLRELHEGNENHFTSFQCPTGTLAYCYASCEVLQRRVLVIQHITYNVTMRQVCSGDIPPPGSMQSLLWETCCHLCLHSLARPHSPDIRHRAGRRGGAHLIPRNPFSTLTILADP